jgi:predicted amidohydrolase
MEVACCQFDITWEDKAVNCRRVETLLGAAGLAPGTLVLLPEMFATGFTMRAATVAEPVDGPTARFLADLARRHEIFLEAGVVIAGEGDSRPKNEVLAFGPEGRLLGRYAKMHLFSFAGEPEHYAPGQSPAWFPWQEAQVATAICYDLRFPELFRVAATRGADLLTVIACWPAPREQHWRALLRARAIENQCYVAAVNRTGQDPSGLAYSGGSQILDPRGAVLAEAGDREGVIRASIDLESQRRYRHEFPALRDIRIPPVLPGPGREGPARGLRSTAESEASGDT